VLLPEARTVAQNLGVNRNTVEEIMKILSALVIASAMLCGCISSSSPNPPAKTTVVVPPNSTTTVVCQDGTSPPCKE
jgi:hypothetical protein